MIKQFAFALSFVALAACGGSTSTVDAKVVTIDSAISTIDAPVVHTIDAMVSGTNSVGDVCSQTSACADGSSCATFTQGATSGVCAPACANNSATCAANYAGPSGGTPMCVLQAQGDPSPTACAVVCTVAGTSQCPGGSTCATLGSGMICQAP